MSNLKLGIIGLSEGNGHPYSWSAICNGYDVQAMDKCEFPTIPRYLSERRWPDDQIEGVKVTHIWTEDRSVSERVAAASLIPNIVDSSIDMIGAVDGILLARDDAEQHFRFAAPFLRAGLPVYIDKPFALSLQEASRLMATRTFQGQIYSCSALRYAKELSLTASELAAIGMVRHIIATVPKDWDRYAIHALEPALMLIPDRGRAVAFRKSSIGRASSLAVEYASGACLTIHALGAVAAPISLKVIGHAGWRELVFQDSFSAFKSALETFKTSIEMRQSPISDDFLLEVAELLEAGR
ncbi:Gfo/Idh/MocA family oxidoreductase [Shinella sumterensis]|uniref:Gfo/Idh/MocA family oxidoreductase n=1 Tax=Shinella sumterensis TaxID=1967501 RepID=A0AA50CI24_9HYPH|nr:Gfo/Idh/MocA family oxidoreductase [Shinella sumterensis]WLR96187.1 Gfo/Idh/MocA family oxidoreductase [Shinella sumterensis]